MKLLYGSLLSLAISILCQLLVILAFYVTLEFFSGCNRRWLCIVSKNRKLESLSLPLSLSLELIVSSSPYLLRRACRSVSLLNYFLGF